LKEKENIITRFKGGRYFGSSAAVENSSVLAYIYI